MDYLIYSTGDLLNNIGKISIYFVLKGTTNITELVSRKSMCIEIALLVASARRPPDNSVGVTTL